ncbi:DUF4178 domain-containing protein [Chitinophaga rhizosphaerae]|uniref:DUF4178 domain-containing protein n=1 Tax=Chitinophaga rhizosphaerae TaxID=1864947 RepID=UPI0013DFA9B4|nr:DUF4178 domain-containing protein [Chitinophaga rhizosphaerae]
MDQPKYTVRCPDCRTVYNGWDEETLYYGCGKCKSLLRWHDVEFVKHRTMVAPTHPNTFALGTTGQLFDRQWRIISYAQRYETGTKDAIWQEYLLFDEANFKYAWLSEFEGHWLFVETIPESDISIEVKDDIHHGRATYFMDRDFQRYHTYKSKYRYFSGEFPYLPDALKGIDCVEYISPPYVLTRESGQDGTEWSLAQYVTPRILRKAFTPAESLPERIGVGSAQPFSTWIKPRAMIYTALAFCVLVWGTQAQLNGTARNEEVFAQYIPIDTATEGKPVTSSSFEIKGRPALVEIRSRGSVDNSWVEASVDMINETTGEEKSFALGVEYYHGADGGESWSEGSTGSTETLCAVEPGRYHLVITPFKDTNTKADWIEIYGYHDTPSWWNAIWAMAFMAAFSIGLYYWEDRFEKNRWYGTKFNPYHEED